MLNTERCVTGFPDEENLHMLAGVKPSVRNVGNLAN